MSMGIFTQEPSVSAAARGMLYKLRHRPFGSIGAGVGVLRRSRCPRIPVSPSQPAEPNHDRLVERTCISQELVPIVVFLHPPQRILPIEL